MLRTQGMETIMVIDVYDVLRPPRPFSTWDTGTKGETSTGAELERAEGARDMGWTDGVTPDGRTWLIWRRKWLTLRPAPPTCIWAMSMRHWAGKC